MTLRRSAAAGLLALALALCAGCTSGPDLLRTRTSPGPLPVDPPRSAPPLPGSPLPVDPPRSGAPGTGPTPADPPGLDAAAAALDEEGRVRFADTYGSVAVDAPHRRVVLYAVDAERGRQLVAAVRRAHPATARTAVAVRPCRYAERRLEAAVDALLAAAKAHRLPYDLYTIAPAPDASGLRVEAPAAAAASDSFARALRAAAGGVPVAVAAGRQPEAAAASAGG
ncbi:hypothetical protein LO771_12470 [Streptacidiphilus sp. ASG 303]|uniref:hypothetical protein n=1 Tax=Streptacidiphilus sp. ASG 303 TaxID=2896847 RepID=UPI001E37D308|nr:hypothetical protein [Streptacidiphilus sp. ASG 303]MCD0483200.1 hypothetical protein [Streptacidiphilus sp. ASG 303]